MQTYQIIQNNISFTTYSHCYFFFFRFQTGCLCFHLISEIINEKGHDKTNKMSVLPAKTQISLGMRPV